MTTIAIRERVDGNNAVAELHGELVRLIGLVLDPEATIADKLAYIHRDPTQLAHVIHISGPRGIN